MVDTGLLLLLRLRLYIYPSTDSNWRQVVGTGTRDACLYRFYTFYTASAIPLQHGGAGWRTILWLLRQSRHDGRNKLRPSRRRIWNLVLDLVFDVAARERRPACKAFVGHRGKGIDILRGSRLIAVVLLWRHIEQGAGRQLARHARHRLLDLARDAEVEDIRRPVLSDHHVTWLHIAMHHAFRVRVFPRSSARR